MVVGGVLASHAPGTAELLANAPANAQSHKVPVIDCHVHVGIEYLNNSPRDLTDPWSTVADPEATLERNDEAGINYSIVCSINATTYGEANKQVAAICRRHPGRMIGFARHNSEREKGRIRSMLDFEVRELGLRGLGELHTTPSREMLDAARDLKLPVLYHPDRVAYYEEFLPHYPEVNFILAHLGSDLTADWDEHLRAIELSKRYQNLYLDTSTVVVTRFLEMAVRELPPEKLVFGSDEPEVDCRTEIYKIRMMNLPKEHEDMILGGNMLRLLGGTV